MKRAVAREPNGFERFRDEQKERLQRRNSALAPQVDSVTDEQWFRSWEIRDLLVGKFRKSNTVGGRPVPKQDFNCGILLRAPGQDESKGAKLFVANDGIVPIMAGGIKAVQAKMRSGESSIQLPSGEYSDVFAATTARLYGAMRPKPEDCDDPDLDSEIINGVEDRGLGSATLLTGEKDFWRDHFSPVVAYGGFARVATVKPRATQIIPADVTEIRAISQKEFPETRQIGVRPAMLIGQIAAH